MIIQIVFIKCISTVYEIEKIAIYKRPQQLFRMIQAITGNQLHLISVFLYYITPVIIIRREYPKYSKVINSHLLYFLKMYLLHIKLTEVLLLRLIIINVAIIFNNKEIIFGTYRHTVYVFKVFEALYSLSACIKAVEPIISLYPKHIVVRLDNPFDEITGKTMVHIGWFVQSQISAVVDIQPIA